MASSSKENWTGFKTGGTNGVKKVPRTAACLFNWGHGEGYVIVEGCFAPGQEDLVEEEFQRLHGRTRPATREEFREDEFHAHGFSIFTPSIHEPTAEELLHDYWMREQIPAPVQNHGVHISVTLANGRYEEL